MRSMKITRKPDGFYKPKQSKDLSLFMHFCNGAIAVTDIDGFRQVFLAHGWSYTIEPSEC